MRISKFLPRQMKFLELYFAGAQMKDAARAAGYRGSSDQSLCNTGREILRKLVGDRSAVFGRRIGARGAVVQLVDRR